MEIVDRRVGQARPSDDRHDRTAVFELPAGDALRIHTPSREVVGRRNLILAAASLVADALVIAAAYLIAKDVRTGWGADLIALHRFDAVILLTIPAWLLIFFVSGLYGRRRVTEGAGEIVQLFQAISWSMVLVIVTAFAFRIDVSREWILILWLSSMGLLVAERLAMRGIIYFLNSRHWIGFRTVIIGTNSEARALRRTFDRKPHLGYEVVGFVAADAADHHGGGVLSDLDGLRGVVEFYDIGAVIAAGSALGSAGMATIDNNLQRTGVRVRVSLGLPHLAASRVMVEPVDGLALLSVERRQLTRQQTFQKRIFDLVVGAAALLVALPIMAVVGLVVAVTSGMPVLFRQTRVGAEGEPFTMYKFRTMVVDAEQRLATLKSENQADGALFKLQQDPRITRAGKYLRKLALDELPQLFNVIKGDMSLVGPRPALPEEVHGWPEELRSRLRAKPGLTGLWQVSGRHELTFEDYMRYDLFYVENWSLGLDTQIVARTVPALLGRRGSY